MMLDPRPYLLPLQQQALMTAAEIRSPRDHALFSLALGAGLSARAINQLDVGQVTRQGASVRSRFEIGPCDRRVFAANDNGEVVLPAYVRLVLARHLEVVKERCHHFSKPMQTLVDAEGRTRCVSCGHEIDFMKLPLFLSRFRDRLSTRRMRSLFMAYRENLRLPGHLHFDSLKATFDAGRTTDFKAA
jgi:site-specific recombinase XerC